MCVLTLDDAQGSLEVVVFPDAFRQHGHLAEEGRMVLVKGRCERDDEAARVLASEIAPIEVVIERLASSVAITLSAPQHDRETFMQLWDVLLQHKGDRRVAIELRDPDRHLRVTIDVNAQVRVRPSERLVADVERICGAGSVSLR
jgi:DNA polymerase-3 subunit alpha